MTDDALTADPAPSPPAPVGQTTPPTCLELFLGFLELGLTGFGGVLPMARRMMVEKRRWLTAEAFAELLGLCQFLPGGNIINMAVAIGHEARGARGAAAALGGLVFAPTVIVILLGIAYDQLRQDPQVRHLFAGLAAAAAGLLVATAIKMVRPLGLRPVPLALAAITLGAIAILRLPLLPVMLVMAPIAVLITWRTKA